MTRTSTKALAVVLGASIAISGVCTAFPAMEMEVSALDTTTQVTYPFATGENAFQYAPTFTMATEKASADRWEYVEVKFDGGAKDVRDAKYLAIQIRVDKGDPGLTVGLIENSDRFNNSTDGNKFYFLSENGSMKEMRSLYSAINLGAGACGTLLMPVSSMSWQWNNSQSDLSEVTAFYFTANAVYNFDYVLTIGDVGYYDGEPDAAATNFVKLVDCSEGEREKTMYYVDSANPDCMTMPSDSQTPAPEAPAIGYPFRTGEDAYVNAAEWGGFSVDGTKSNQQTVTVDLGTADFSEASYLIVQYKCGGSPGLQYKLMEGDNAYSIVGMNDNPIYFATEGETTSSKTCNISFDHLNVLTGAGSMGALIISMTSMKWEGAAGDLTKIDSLVITTNAQYNGGFDLLIGEIGMYEGEAGSGTFTKLLDLSEKQDDKFSVTSALEENRGKLTFLRAARQMLGDATVDFTADKMVEGSFTKAEKNENEEIIYTQTGGGIWTGGSYGKRELTTDAYGDQAVRFTALGSNPYGDAYTAFDLAPTGGFSWAGMKGISFYARNDSDVEIAFNIEVDCKTLVPVNGEEKSISDRFNVKQGYRFWLYDINTGKTTIYMTRPTATLPAGFEGWVRIPFEAFNRADWSTNGVTKEYFMDENSTVTYLALTVHAATYANLSFTVNKFGGYATTPQFSSSFIDAGGKTIPELMGLTQEEN